MRRPFAWIWPRARTVDSSACGSPPAALTASPTAVISGITSRAANPTLRSFCDALTSSGNSNGVFAANDARSASIFFAASALPSIVVNAICACCFTL
jgi:hypothetical protein